MSNQPCPSPRPRAAARLAAPAGIALAGLFLLARPARAYLDPGSGSFIYQILIASLLGASVAVKVYWRKIKGLFVRRSDREKDGPQADE